jgi:hypothetical protein
MWWYKNSLVLLIFIDCVKHNCSDHHLQVIQDTKYNIFNTNISIQFKYNCQTHSMKKFKISYSQMINIKYLSSVSHFKKFLYKVTCYYMSGQRNNIPNNHTFWNSSGTTEIKGSICNPYFLTYHNYIMGCKTQGPVPKMGKTFFSSPLCLDSIWSTQTIYSMLKISSLPQGKKAKVWCPTHFQFAPGIWMSGGRCYILYSAQHYLNGGRLLYPWRTEIHLPVTNPMTHSARLLLLTAKVTLTFENSARELTWPRIRHCL